MDASPQIRRLAAGLLTALRLWLNVPGFAVRSRLAWKRPGYCERPGSGPRLSAAEQRLLEVPRACALAGYGLEKLRPLLSERSWQINLIYADLLDQVLDHFRTYLGNRFPRAGAPLRALDIGSKNFEYAPALHTALQAEFGVAPALTGIELDAWRIYPSLHSRHDAAQYYLGLLAADGAGCRQCQYLAGDLLTLPAGPGAAGAQEYALITWFYPFLTPLPLARWGLPRRYLRPATMLAHALDLLAPGGALLIVNQTAIEATAQRKLLRKAGCAFQWRRFKLGLALGAPSRWVFMVGAAAYGD